MTSNDGATVIGISIGIVNDNPEQRLFLEKQFGKYAKEGDCIWSFCYECWLDSLMGMKKYLQRHGRGSKILEGTQ